MVDNYMQDKLLDKIGIDAKIRDTKILSDTGNKLADDITSKNVVIIITCVVKMMINFIHKYFYEKHKKY